MDFLSSEHTDLNYLEKGGVSTFSRAREEMYTCSAVSTTGASDGGALCTDKADVHTPSKSTSFIIIHV